MRATTERQDNNSIGGGQCSPREQKHSKEVVVSIRNACDDKLSLVSFVVGASLLAYAANTVGVDNSSLHHYFQ